MRGYPSDIVAALSEAEVNALRCVYEIVCTEFGIPRNGKQAQRLANCLLADFRRYPLNEETLLLAARAFCRDPTREPTGRGNSFSEATN